MPSLSPPPGARSPEGEGLQADLFDYGLLKDYLGFVFGGVRRHPALASGVFTGVAVVSIAMALLMPKTFHVETKILAQRNQVMASLGNPHRSIPFDSDAPTRAAQETVLRRDNLVSLVKQTNLLDQWDATRAPILRFKDAVLNAVAGPPDDADRLDAMLGLLEKRLKVTTDNTTVTIAIDWPTAQLAYQLVEAAQQNFLEARHVSEVSAIAEAISILEMHASTVHDTIDEALQQVQSLHDGKRKAPGPAAPLGPVAPKPVAAAAPKGPEINEHELAQLKFILKGKRRAIADLEEFRGRRLTELNAALAEQKVMYSDQHPVILDTRQRISSLQQESPQITALKHDEAELVAEYTRKGGRDPDALIEPRAPVARSRATELEVAAPSRSLEGDPAMDYAQGQLKMATSNYEELMMRIDAAKIELDTARAAFKYRYSVVNPAQLPKKPLKPNVPVLIFAGLLAAALTALFAGTATEVWKGRIVERWQVERTLGLPVLAEVKRT